MPLKAIYRDPDPVPPEGYRWLKDNEIPRVDDLVFNILGCQWEKIPEHILLINELFGGKSFHFPPIRKIDGI